MEIPVYSLNAFAKVPGGGNPAGVVLQANGLSEVQMQKVAAIVGFSETAFVQKSDLADFQVRFFTPEGEVDLCGHATIATFSLMQQQGTLPAGRYQQETKAGVLDIEIRNDGTVFMAQNHPQFCEKPTAAEIIDCLNLPPNFLQEDLPIQVVTTGLRDILVPIQSLEKLFAIQPNFDKVSALSQTYDVIGIHMFTLESLSGATAHCRNLAPLYGIPEESATGTSNGALSCYLHRYGIISDTTKLVYEQGYSMQKPSEIHANLVIEDDQIQAVWVGGTAELAGNRNIQLN